MTDFLYRPVKYNFSSRKGQKVKFLVVHDTGNSSKGADAMAHQRYFGGGNRNASAHYFVDDKRIVQIIGDSYSSWHCGDNQGHGRALNGCKNATSIGIELCINSDGDYQKAYANLVELVKNLMQKFDVPASRVCRHYDVSRKSCPNSFRANNWSRWTDFKAKIQEPIKVKFDLSKDSKGEDMAKALEEREKAVEKDHDKKFEAKVEEDKELAEIGAKFEQYEEKARSTEPNAWAEEAWNWAKEKGITDGTAPQRVATREEIAVMMYRAIKEEKDGKQCNCSNANGTGYRTGL